MNSLDAIILARLLLRDDARQYARARQLLAQDCDDTATITVMQELVWVLEVNDCAREDIAHGLNLLLGLPNFKPQLPEALRQALACYGWGLDFADALHLALSHGSEKLASVDKAFAKQSKKRRVSPLVRLAQGSVAGFRGLPPSQRRHLPGWQ
ncbi:MAG: PIN domain-containing protein [Betaproteobacteria bacterium]